MVACSVPALKPSGVTLKPHQLKRCSTLSQGQLLDDFKQKYLFVLPSCVSCYRSVAGLVPMDSSWPLSICIQPSVHTLCPLATGTQWHGASSWSETINTSPVGTQHQELFRRSITPWHPDCRCGLRTVTSIQQSLDLSFYPDIGGCHGNKE